METFTHRRFYTHTHTKTLLHKEAFPNRLFYTPMPFTHRCLHTQTLLHKDPFTHRRFYTKTRVHTDALAHRGLYTQTLYTQMPLHTDAFTHRHIFTQTLSHTAVEHIARQKHDKASKHHIKFQKPSRTQEKTHQIRNFSTAFDDQPISTLISCERVAVCPSKSQF